MDVRVGPRYSVERQLYSMWVDLLGHQDFGAHDVFFDVGGDSLLAIRMLTRVRRRLGFHLTFDALLEGADGRRCRDVFAGQRHGIGLGAGSSAD